MRIEREENIIKNNEDKIKKITLHENNKINEDNKKEQTNKIK